MAKELFKATDKQIEDLYNSLKGGAPLLLALQFAGISRATYYYWVAMASIVEEARSQAELEEIEEAIHSGVSIQEIRDLSESVASQKRTGVGTFIEPSAESVLQYKNSRKFRNFADKCYEVVFECNKIRSQLALFHLGNIRKSVNKDANINASGSMWFLERTMSDFFAKPSDKAIEQTEAKATVEKIKVEYVDPTSKESEKRLQDMEEDLLKVLNGEGKA